MLFHDQNLEKLNELIWKSNHLPRKSLFLQYGKDSSIKLLCVNHHRLFKPQFRGFFPNKFEYKHAWEEKKVSFEKWIQI